MSRPRLQERDTRDDATLGTRSLSRPRGASRRLDRRRMPGAVPRRPRESATGSRPGACGDYLRRLPPATTSGDSSAPRTQNPSPHLIHQPPGASGEREAAAAPGHRAHLKRHLKRLGVSVYRATA
jgi:hypothetical protein